jgi:hypothetical protein
MRFTVAVPGALSAFLLPQQQQPLCSLPVIRHECTTTLASNGGAAINNASNAPRIRTLIPYLLARALLLNQAMSSHPSWQKR